MVIQSVGQTRIGTPRHDEVELARAIRLGARRRPDQAFGEYYVGRRASCALGAAYEGIHLLPDNADKVDPVDLGRLFDCLDNTLSRCPVGCGKGLSLAAMILHLNDDHQWSRERIADWLAPAEALTPA